MGRWLMNDECEGIWKEAALAWLRYCPGICLERLSKYHQKPVRKAGVGAEIRTEYPTNMCGAGPQHKPAQQGWIRNFFFVWITANDRSTLSGLIFVYFRICVVKKVKYRYKRNSKHTNSIAAVVPIDSAAICVNAWGDWELPFLSKQNRMTTC
jgi:hypothetical protein